MKQPPHKLMRNIQINMVKRRKQLGMTQTDLVNEAKVSPAIISLLERGLRPDIQLQTLHNLAIGLRCEVCKLLYGFD